MVRTVPALPDTAEVWDWLSRIPDPEIPGITLTDLGIIRDVAWEGARLVVTVTPTYSGCPATEVIARSAEVPQSAKSAALGRQLDPAAYVAHRGWVGPLVLVVLDDPDDPTPYWLFSCRNPQRMLAALQND